MHDDATFFRPSGTSRRGRPGEDHETQAASDGGVLLTVNGLGAVAGTPAQPRPLLQDISFSMRPGERVGIIGESGSGKTMTALALLGLLPDGIRAGGEARFAGFDGNLLDAPDRALRRLRGNDISMVFQEPLTALDPLQRVGDQVAEVMRIHGTAGSRAEARRRAVQALAEVQLPDPAGTARAFPHQLSGGQRQRVMLATALANEPRLLICDEPTTALDVTVQARMLELISELVRQRDTGLLFITHDLAVVERMCQRVLVLKDGRLVESGPVDRVLSDPQDPYTRMLVDAADLGTARAVGAGPASSGASGDGPDASGSDAGEAYDAGRDDAGAPPVIDARGLSRTFTRPRTSILRAPTRVAALQDATFQVRPGDRLGVVGESGSGKTTLLRLIAGLDHPTSGTATVAGSRIPAATETRLRELRRNVQIVFQDPMGSLDPRMDVEAIVTEPLLAPGLPRLTRQQRRAKAVEILARVGIDEEALERFPHEFSGGQRQRISIARALIAKPRILLADEPVSALDVSVRRQVLELLADLVDEYGLTLVFVSHDLAVVRYLCDRVLVMKDGRIVESGQTEDVYERPSDPYTRTLVASALHAS